MNIIDNEKKKIEEKYRNLSIELETILDIIPGMVFCKDKNDVITRVNQTFADLLKLNKDDIVGKTSFDLFPPEQAEKFFKDDLDVMTSKKPKLNIEESADFPEGKIFAITSKVPHFNENGEVFGTIGLSIDITERKVIEQKLKESEGKYRSVIDALTRIGIGIDIVDLNFKILYQNKVLQDIYGQSEGKLCYKAYLGLDESCDFCPMIKAVKNNKIDSAIIPAPNGRIYEVISAPLSNVDGIIDRAAEVIIDITERKQAETKLKKEREKAELYLNLVNVVIVTLDRDGIITLLNKKGYDILKYEEGELIGKNWFETCLPPRDRNRVYAYFKKLMEGEIDVIESYENPIWTKYGNERLIAWSTILFKDNSGKITGLLSSGEDITERKKIQEALKIKNYAIDSSINAIAIANFKGYLTYVNPSFLKLWGYNSEDEVLGKFNTKFWQAEEKAAEVVNELNEKGGWIGELVAKKKDGSFFDVELSASMVLDAKGKPVYMIASFIDITDRKKAEEMIHDILKREQFLGDIIRNASVGIGVGYPDGRLGIINKAFEELVGYSKEELKKINWNTVLTPPEWREYENIKLEELHLTKQAIRYEKEYVRKDGLRVPIELVVHPKLDDDENVEFYIAFVTDITERKKTEENLKHHLELEHLISRLSSEFINISSEEIDDKITKTLEEIAQFSDTVRASLFLLSEDLTRVTNTNEWCANPNDSQIHLLQDIPFETFGYYKKILEKYKIVKIGCPEDLPMEAKGEWEWIRIYGFRPLLFVPLIYQGTLYGTIGFYGKLNEIRDWSEFFIIILKLMGNNIVNLLERKKAEEHLKESEENYRDLYEEAPNAYFSIGVGKSIIRCNKAAERLLGYTREELLKMKIFDLYSDTDNGLTKAKKMFERFLEGAPVQDEELQMKCKNGKPIWVSLTVKPIIDKQGSVIESRSMVIDITERKKAEEVILQEKKFSERLINSSVDGILAYDLECRYTIWNPGMELISGIKKEDCLGKCAFDVFPFLKETGEDKFFYDSLDGKTIIAKDRPYRVPETGNKGFFEGHYSPLYDETDKIIGGIAIIRDITDRKIAEEILKEHAKKMEKLNRIIIESNKAEDLNLLLENILTSTIELMNFNGGGIYLINESKKIAEIVFHKGLSFDFVEIVKEVKIDAPPYNTVLFNGKSIFAKDYSNIHLDISKKLGFLSFASVPLFAKGKVIGALNITSKERHIFTNLEMDVLQSIGREIGTVISKLAAEQKLKKSEISLRKSQHELKIRNQISNIFLIVPDENIYTEVLKIVLNALNSDYGLFGYINDNGDIVYPSLTRDIWEKCQIPDKTIIFPRETWGGVWGKALLNKKTLYSNEPFKVPEGHISILNTIDVPIIHQNNLIGNLQVGNKENGYNEEDVKMLESIANSIAPILSARLQRDRIEERRKIAEKKLKESEEKFKYIANELEMILDNIPGLVFFKDTKNNFIRVNKYHADAQKFRKEDMEGASCFDIYPKEQAQSYWEDDLEVIKTRKPKINIIEPWDTPEGTRWALTSKIPYIDKKGNISGIIGFAADITERKKSEEKLKESKVRYREAYEQADFYKDLFAHDISNILQNIQASLGLLSMWRNQPEKIEKTKDVMNIINDQIVRGSKLVSNIRKLSQISETEFPLESVEVIQILKDAIKFIYKSYPERDLKIEIDSRIEEILVQANELLLDVFENILINAVKYNTNPKIEILTKLSKEIKNGTNFIKIEFIDNGVGVPDVMKERIFGGIAPRKDKVHGMGLGLLLVKSIISNFNGEIWVEDKIKGDPSQGSNFIVLIPEVV